MKKINSLKNISHSIKSQPYIAASIVIVLFFIPACLITFQAASPYCRADDWRLVTLYLEPLYSGNLGIKNLWSDPVHPMPVYALLYITSAKLFNLQIHYIAWFSIFFQLLLGYLIIITVIKSFKDKLKKHILLLIPVIGLCTYIFSFVGMQTYLWPIMTACFVGLFIVLLIGYTADNYCINNKDQRNKLKGYLTIGVVIILSILFFSDWAIIFCLGLVAVMAIIIIFDKENRKQRLILSFVIIISAVIGFAILEYFLIENPRNLQTNSPGLYSLFIKHFFLSFKAIGVAVFSGVIDYNWFTKQLQLSENTFLFLSIVFMLLYLGVLILYFIKEHYKRSLLPPVMMLFTLIYILTVLYFRYNPVDDGQFCTAIPRYVIFYQIGIIGFFWSVYLLIMLPGRNKKPGKTRITVASLLTVLLIIGWVVNFRKINKTAKYLESKYPEVSQDIRSKLYDTAITVPWSNQPGRDISRQLEFLYLHKLNIFAPNYPYSENKSEDIQNIKIKEN